MADVTAMFDPSSFNLATANQTRASLLSGASAADLVAMQSAEEAQKQSQLVEAQKRKADFDAQEATRKFAQSVGPDELKGLLIQTFKENTEAAVKTRNDMRQLDSTSFFDNPLGFISNQFTLESKKTELADQIAAADNAQKSLNQISAMTSATGQAEQATKQIYTTESLEAASKMDIAKSQVVLSQMQAANLRNNSKDLADLQAGILQTRQDARAERSMQMQEEQFKLSQTREKRQAESAAIDLELNQLRATKIKAEIQSEEQMLGVINTVATATGKPTYPSIELLNKMTTEKERETLLSMYSGMLERGTTNGPWYGDSGAETLFNTDLVRANFNGRPEKATIDYIKSVNASAEVNNDMAVKEAKTEKEIKLARAMAINKKIANDQADWAKDAERAGSKFMAPSISAVVKAAPKLLANDPVFEQVIKPAIESSVDVDNNAKGTALMGLLKAGIANGSITSAQANDYGAKFFAAVAANNNALLQFGNMGLKKQIGYNVNIGDINLDISKPEQFAKAMMLQDFSVIASKFLMPTTTSESSAFRSDIGKLLSQGF